ncbi:hypothetical protein Q1695_001448 [Nippostrongylus brasiliensis]|nr:hypothetical protein Q1695_001448 [Nippostrongylus brasiliensis]
MHIYSDVRVPCVHSVYEELRSGCAVNLYGSFRRNKDAKSFMVELLSRSAAVMVLEFDLTHSEIRAFSASTAGVDRLKAFNFDFKQIRRFHLHISVSDSYFDIEMNGTFIGCFIPVGDIRTVTNDEKNSDHVSLRTMKDDIISAFPGLVIHDSDVGRIFLDQ